MALKLQKIGKKGEEQNQATLRENEGMKTDLTRLRTHFFSDETSQLLQNPLPPRSRALKLNDLLI